MYNIKYRKMHYLPQLQTPKTTDLKTQLDSLSLPACGDVMRLGRVRAEPNPFSLVHTTIQSLSPIFFPSRMYIIQSIEMTLASFCLHSASLLGSRRTSKGPSLYPHNFPYLNGQLWQHLLEPPLRPLSFLYGDCSPIARKICPSQLILKPSAKESAFSTVGSTLGILHGISGILIHI